MRRKFNLFLCNIDLRDGKDIYFEGIPKGYVDKNGHRQNNIHILKMNEIVVNKESPLYGDGILRHTKNKYCDLSGVKIIRIHDFRHSCATVLINNGASIIIVAKYLGHAKIDETLNTYSHLFKNKMDEIVQTMNNLE